MENGTWRFNLPTSSSKCDYSDYEDNEDDCEEVEVETDYTCPFCTEDFDIIGLCCHIEEEHHDEAKKGVCPMCDEDVGVHLVEHVVLQHENTDKSRSKSIHSDAESQTTIALIRKELLERSLKSLLESSSSATSSSSGAAGAADQLLTSFIGGYSTPAQVERKASTSLADTFVKEELTEEIVLERSMKTCVISEEKQEEQTQRCKFVQSLLISTFLDDDL